MAEEEEDDYVVICAPVEGHTPVGDSMITTCADCGYQVWITKSMMANVIEAHPGRALARCATCVRKRMIRDGHTDIEFQLPEWQRTEMEKHGADVEELADTAHRWLTGRE